jgi:transketolase
MAALAGGMALHGGFIPCVSTYLAFSDYLRPSLRLAAMMGLRVVYVFTHDSIAVGMDGPTHQAVEQLMSLRAVPNLTVIRPADAAETAEAWRAALSNASGPTALILARQDLPQLRGEAVASARGLRQGAYVLWEPEGGGTDLILIGSGSETHLALQVGRQLGDEGLRARVVSMPCWELFDSQPVEYRENVLPSRVRNRISIEAGVTRGWERYVGLDGETLGVNTYGASAPASCLFQQFGLSPAQVLDRVRRTAVGAPGD